MKNKIIKLISLTVIIFQIFTGCSINNEQQQSMGPTITPQMGGTIKLACFVPDTLNPFSTKYQNVRDVMMVVYESLFKAENTLVATPVLAEGYSVSTSNKIYSINLKKNVQFHDGSLMDAADVLATFDYIKNYDTPYTPIFENVLSYKMIDQYTVSIELISPQADFVNNLDFPILASGLAKQSFTQDNPSFIPIGTGRFKFESRTQNKDMNLVRNDNWHGEQTTYADNIYVSFLHNSNDLFHAFDAGEIDMFTTNGSNWGEFNFTTHYKSFETGSPRYTYLGLNTTKEPLSNVTLRRDINNIIDRKEMTEIVMFSHASPAELPIISSAYYFENRDAISQNNETSQKAPEILKYNLSLNLLYNSESNIKSRAASYLKKELEPYGITLNLQAVDFEEYKKLIEGAEYDLYLGEVVMNNNMNMDFMFSSLQKTSQNLCTFVNNEFDSILANHNMMSPDKENSEITFYNFEKYFKENIPQIPLFHTNSALYVNNRIRGDVKANMSSFYSDIGNLYINYTE